ncbi:beta-hexosaminidase subunit alpha-like [Ylistrum balloti]|uniref:beta-hexosaminidase subunit alpha-like n=1 Tax=Ylistrum balloti TaxID=509963 RepID=UPI002905CA9C|nr:beta-hexosaminidase subunit alpha-like [Ylistrum balloti]
MKRVIALVCLMISTVTSIKEPLTARTLNSASGIEVNNIKRKILTFNAKTPDEDSVKSGYNPYVDISWDKNLFKMKFRGKQGGRFRIGRAPKSTLGEPWPLPQKYKVNRNIVYYIDHEHFEIIKTKNTCDILEKAIQRYHDIIFTFALEEIHENFDILLPKSKLDVTSEMYSNAENIQTLRINVQTRCDKYPSEDSKEGYVISVNGSGIHLDAVEVWGALRGLETISQLVYKYNEKFYIRQMSVNDFPRFRYRGLMVDTARHFLPKDLLYSMLDAMSMNKMNAFHWHIVDDQSFPYQSKAFPELSEKGAFHPSMVYTQTDIADIVEYARLRGIRVIPEFDIPGHTFSWGIAKPELMAQCYSDTGPVPGHYVNLDPSLNKTYSVLEALFTEINDLFHDSYVHTGGDEVPMDCWRSNPGIQQLVRKLDDSWKTLEMGRPLTAKAWNYFVNRVARMVKKIGEDRGTPKRIMMWNEVFRDGLKIPSDSIIQVWFGNSKEVEKVIESGYHVIYSECWYLDKVSEYVQWPDLYLCDPNTRKPGFEKREAMILGGEACLWTENIASESAMLYTWPRTSVVAERLWSHRDVRDVNTAATRLQEHKCRMSRRGIQVSMINGPDYCPPYSHKMKPKVKVDKTITKHHDKDTKVKLLIDQIKNGVPVSVKENRLHRVRLKAQETVFIAVLFLPFLIFTSLYCCLKIKRSKIFSRIINCIKRVIFR